MTMLSWYSVRYTGGKTARVMAVSAEEALMLAGVWGCVVSVELEEKEAA